MKNLVTIEVSITIQKIEFIVESSSSFTINVYRTKNLPQYFSLKNTQRIYTMLCKRSCFCTIYCCRTGRISVLNYVILVFQIRTFELSCFFNHKNNDQLIYLGVVSPPSMMSFVELTFAPRQTNYLTSTKLYESTYSTVEPDWCVPLAFVADLIYFVFLSLTTRPTRKDSSFIFLNASRTLCGISMQSAYPSIYVDFLN